MLTHLVHGRAGAQEHLVRRGAVAAQAEVFGFKLAAGTQHLQAISKITRHAFAKAHVAIAKVLARFVDVQRPKRRFAGIQGHTNGVRERQQALILFRLGNLRTQPNTLSFPLHLLG